MKNTIKNFTAILVIAIIAITVVIGFSACSFDDDTPQTEKKGEISEILKFDNISRLAFMGGSLIYNPDVGASGQISKGATVAVRLSKVNTDENAANPDDRFKETWRAFGYIKVNSVSIQGITLAYSEYNDLGVLKSARTITVNNGASGDLNGDGLPDVSFIPPAFKRSGMENAVYLTFTASQGNGNVGMYSVIPEQYSRQAYPNNVMGVNPDGKLIIMGRDSSGARAAIRGAEHGDIVVDTMDNTYATIKNGRKFRSAAERIGDTEDDITIISTDGFSDTGNLMPDGNFTDADKLNSGPVYSPDSVPGQGTEEGDPAYFIADEFTVYATPQGLYDALPASLKSTSPSTEAAYIAAINEILKVSPVTLIDSVLNSGTFDSDFISEVNELKSDITGSESELRTVLINRIFLAGAYPALCQTPAAQTLGDMFPILSLSFSAGDTDNLVVADVSASIRQANMQFSSAMQNSSTRNNSRAAGGYTDGYTKFTTQKASIEKEFKDKFTKIPGPYGGSVYQFAIGATYSDNAKIRTDVGLYGSITSYWGKIEMGVGAAALILVQMEGLNATTSLTPPITFPTLDIPLGTIPIGPVILKVSLDGEPGLTFNVSTKTSNTFIGFIGMYGGRVWVGADYGVKFKWKVIPVSAYFNPYAKAENVSETAWYAGPIKDIESDTQVIDVSVVPSFYIGPKISWNALYAKVGVEVGVPVTLQIQNHGKKFAGAIDLTFAGKAKAGIEFKVLCFSYTYDFVDWYFTPPLIIPMGRFGDFIEYTDSPINNKKAFGKFPVNQVRQADRSPSNPPSFEDMRLYNFTNPRRVVYSINTNTKNTDMSEGQISASDLNIVGGYFQLTQLIGDNKFKLDLYNADGTSQLVVSKSGKILNYFDEGFVFQTTGTQTLTDYLPNGKTFTCNKTVTVSWVFLYEPLGDRTDFTVRAFKMP